MMWREHGRVIGGWRSVVAPAALHARPQHNHDGRQAPLQAPWRADADERPHQEAQVESADVHDEPFQDVRVAAQMGPPADSRATAPPAPLSLRQARCRRRAAYRSVATSRATACAHRATTLRTDSARAVVVVPCSTPFSTAHVRAVSYDERSVARGDSLVGTPRRITDNPSLRCRLLHRKVARTAP